VLGQLAVAGLLLVPALSRASMISKTDDANALNLPTSWMGGAVPGVNDIAQFDSHITASRAPNLGAGATWLGIKLSNPGGAISLANSPAATLTLLSSGIDMSGATADLTLQCGLTLSAGQTWTVASGRTLDASSVTLARSMHGTVDFSKSGTIKIANPLTLGIVGPWATCGGDDWAAGAAGGAVSALPVGSYTANLASGNNTSTNANPSPGTFTTGTLKTTASFDWTANPGDIITLDNGGILIPSGVSNYLSAPGGTVTLKGPASSGELVFQGGGTLQLDSTAIIANNGGNCPLTKSGSGTLIMNGANTYSGGTTLNAGMLVIGNNSALGTSAAGNLLTINGGTLDCIGNRAPGNSSGSSTHAKWNGDFTFLGGDNGNRTLTMPYNLVDFTRDIRITVVGGTLATPKQMYGPYGFTKDGAGTFLMSRLNDISGVVHMVAGTLNLQNITGEGTGSQIGYNLVNATLDVQGGTIIFNTSATNHCVAGLTGSGTVDFSLSGGGILPFTLAVGGANDTTFSGSLIGANGGLLKLGNNKQTLTGPNSYGGNTVICMDNSFQALATNNVLALSGNGSVSNSASIILGFIGLQATHFGYTYQSDPNYSQPSGGLPAEVNPFGATFDVSGVTGGSYTLDGSVSQTLMGNGTVKGKLVVPSGSSVAPGVQTFLAPDGFGALTFTVAPTLQGTVSMKINKNGSTLTSDLITVASGGGTLTYGGTLTVTATGDGLAAGDTFTLFSAGSYAGGFTTLNLPDVSGAGLQWNTGMLNVNGSIKVEAIGALDPVTSFTIGKSGSNLSFGYAGGSGSQFVLVRSYSVTVPVSTWTPMATNTTTPGSFTIPIGSAPAAFYRVRSQ
jgi:autotransporter-associated beta strand protein